MQLAPNDLLQGRYRVQALIAQGGMGAVYRAVDERLGNTVALKQTLMSDPQLRAAFEREARLLAGLQHPALPVVSDHFTEGQGQFLVMQYIPGDDLAALLAARGGPFPLAEVMPWADRLLDVLDYLHTQSPPIIHRDIKPQNLKLTPRGEIILLDFGLAKGELGGGSPAGGRSVFGYTPQYAPIEQIQGAGTGPRSDLYSFAATVYQLLTGEAPPDALARAAATLGGQPDPLRPAHHVNAQLPAAVGGLLHASMAQSAPQRPASAAALRASLRSAAQAAPSIARTVSAGGGASSAGQPTIALAREGVADAPQAASPMKWRIIGAAAALGAGLLVAAAFVVLQVMMGRVADGSGGGGAPRPTAVAVNLPAGAAGSARSSPLAVGATAQISGWDIRTSDVLRGDAAWNLLHETNANNEPAPEGQEYVLVRLRARPLQGSESGRDLYPKLTGDGLTAYLPVAAVTPNQIPEEYAANSEHEVDYPYLAKAGEANLLLQLEQLGGPSDERPVFVAIDAGAALAVDRTLGAIKAAPLGADPREPAAIGEMVTTEDFQVTLREVLRGDAAYQRLLEANRYNDPPGEGAEYLLALVEVRSIATKDETVLVSDSDFYSVRGDADNVEGSAMRYASVVEPEPALSFYLYPGGSAGGWVAVEVPKGAPNVRLVFGPGFSSDDLNTRYFAIE
jgi:hypothetical protein